MARVVQTFEEWMAEVDTIIQQMCGMSAADLDDAPYRDMYDRDYTTTRAARNAIKKTRVG